MEAVLAAQGVAKRFGAVTALRGVSLDFRPGEVHGIVGENGAGKSTLMKILAGVERPDEGEIRVDGKAVRFGGVRDALGAGIALIHQELNLVDDLTAAENIALGREPRVGPFVNRARQREEAARLLAAVGASARPDDLVGRLPLAQRQLVEIAKALATGSRVLIMDEPTAVLGRQEADALFALVARLREEGRTVVYISHLLPEVVAICDRISVMRDGEWVTTLPAAEATPAGLANLMVGRELGDFYPDRQAPADSEPLLKVENVRDVSLEVGPGEIVGLAGLVGAGRTEMCEAVAGLRPRGGRVTLGGKTLRPGSPTAAVEAGVAYVGEDRKGKGLVLGMSVAENVTLAHLRHYGRLVLDRRREREAAEAWRTRLQIKATDLSLPVGSLSGGNQQKVVLAKWLDTRPKVLLLDEPTRGVDVGAKREIYEIVVALAAEGLACLVVSSEMPELLGLCHRILVMRNGRIVGQGVSEEEIMALAAGVGEVPA